MSYADAYLDLSSINVACLSGNNGAGKSALLDAATWAIWEKGRATSDELIRLGQKEMWVELIFSHEGSTYRIRRSRQRTPSRSGNNKATTKSTIDLQMLVPGSGGFHPGETNLSEQANNENGASIESTTNTEKVWKSLSASSVSDTQDKILQLLRMDYQTFVNSAYLRQGAADQFARETPAKRKEILGEILSLSYFDRLQERCKSKLKPLKEKCEFLNSLLARLPEIENEIKLLEEKQVSVQSGLVDYRQAKDKLDAELTDLQRQEHELKTLSEKQASMQSQLASLENEIVHLNNQKNELGQKLVKLQALTQNKEVLEIEFQEYENTSAALKDLEEKSFIAQSLEKQKIELRSKLSAQRSELELEVKQAKNELTESSERRTRLVYETKNAETITKEYEQYQASLAQEIHLAKQQETYVQIKQRMTELQTVIDEAQVRLTTELEQKKEQVSRLNALLGSQELIDKQKLDLETREVELDQKEKEFQYVSNKGQELKARIENHNFQIKEKKSRQQEFTQKIEELNKAADSSTCPLCSGKIIDKAAVITRYEFSINDAEKEIVALQLEQQNMEKEIIALRARYAELNTELGQRKALDMQKGQLKEKHLAVKEAQETLRKLQAEVEMLEKQKAQNDYAIVQRTSLINLSGELNELKFDPVLYTTIQAQIRGQRGIEARYHQLEKDISEIKKVDANLPALTAKIQLLESTLAEESYAGDTRVAIGEIDKQWQELNYDVDIHTQLREKVSSLLPKLDKYRDLKHALNEIPLTEKALTDAESWLSLKVTQQADLNQKISVASNSADDIEKIETEVLNLKNRIKDSQKEFETLLQEEAKINANMQSSKDELEAYQNKRNELDEAKQALEDYTFLAECFGKKGIQAIIIENAIPEIETDANRLLSRLTDNKMHISLVTQQKNKSGNISETLDIAISDDLGIRSYELYSGGEAFKVNFAIRVALSRLLARRAGAKLETLIIDEGFGSQDDQSRDKLVKAIRSIQSDFARILVITHFADVKDMFPTHIQINKSSGVSNIELIN